MSGSDSEPEVDQLEAFRNANIKPGMFVSGWDDSQDEVIEEKNPHETPQKEILWAVNEKKIDLVRSILERYPSCKSATDDEGYSPLHRACYNNFDDIAKLLISHGANVNALTEYQWTPLHSAVKWKSNDCAALLLQHGADVNAETQGNQTPLHICATVSDCRQSAMTLLFDPNCKADALNNSEETAFQIAERAGLTYPIFEMGHSAYKVETGLID